MRPFLSACDSEEQQLRRCNDRKKAHCSDSACCCTETRSKDVFTGLQTPKIRQLTFRMRTGLACCQRSGARMRLVPKSARPLLTSAGSERRAAQPLHSLWSARQSWNHSPPAPITHSDMEMRPPLRYVPAQLSIANMTVCQKITL